MSEKTKAAQREERRKARWREHNRRIAKKHGFSEKFRDYTFLREEGREEEAKFKTAAARAIHYGYDPAGLKDVHVGPVKGVDKARSYFEQHDLDRLQYTRQARQSITQELDTQQKEILQGLATGQVRTKQQLETGSLAQVRQQNFESAVERGQRIAKIGSLAIKASNARAQAEAERHQRQIENQANQQRAGVFGVAGGVVGAIGGGLIGFAAGGPVGAAIGASTGYGVGSSVGSGASQIGRRD